MSMAVIKSKEIHTMTSEDLTKRLAEFRLELAKARGQISVGGSPPNAGKMRETKKTVARILTELKLKKIKSLSQPKIQIKKQKEAK